MRDRSVFSIAGLLALGTFALFAFIIASDYGETRAQVDTALGNVAGAIERNIARNVELYDLTLQETVDGLRLPGLAQADPELRHAAIFDRIATADYMSSVLVIDAAGKVVAESDSMEPHTPPVANRDYFVALRDHPSVELYVGAALADARTGRPVLTFARRLSGPDGTFAGAVAGSVQLDYFYELSATLQFGRGGAVTLLRTDGLVLARFPQQPGQIGHSIAGTEALRTMLRDGSGMGEDVSAVDGVERIYAFRRVGTLPLIVTASYGRAAVFAGWQRKSLLICAAFTVLVAVAGALLFALRRQLDRRAAAERRALASADQARRSERNLALSLHQLDAVFQYSADIHYAASRRADGRLAFELLNRHGEKLTGLYVVDMVGKTPHECLPDAVADLVLLHWEDCLHTGETVSYEHSTPTRHGLLHWETRLVPVIDAAETASRLIGTTRDITERKLTEAALLDLNTTLERQVAAVAAAHDDALVRAAAAERLQLLGKLASGIAHDVNNVLQTVASCATIIERRADETDTMHRIGRMIADAATRGAAITQRLLAFSRPDARRGTKPAARTELAPLFAGLLDILRHTLRSGGPIDVSTRLEGDDLTVLAEATQLETVLLNLATNARDAMPEGGTLVLGAAAATTHPVLGEGDYVRLWVRDTGTGMDAETLARVTEPFFTTKPVGEGTGLGLSMADTFAQEAGGLLDIHSLPGHGTVVELWLPR